MDLLAEEKKEIYKENEEVINKVLTEYLKEVKKRNRNRQEILRNPENYYRRIEELRERVKRCGVPSQIEKLDELKELFDLEVAKHEKTAIKE